MHYIFAAEAKYVHSYNGFIDLFLDCDYLWGVSETSQKKSGTFCGRASESQQPMHLVLYNPTQC